MQDTETNSWNLWKEKVIQPFIDSQKGKELALKVKKARETTTVYPAANEIFNAFLFCPIDNIKIVLIGLDPYNKGNHAHGLSFSSKQMSTPPSLRVIFKELRRDLYSYMTDEDWKKFFPNNNLTNWARRGMLLLNRFLTVEKGDAKSHADYGWDTFQKDYVFKFLNEYDKPLVFVLWGKDAQELEPWINTDKHHIIKGAHPAADTYNPAQPKFYGCGHFSEINKFLTTYRKDDLNDLTLWIEKYFKEELFDDFKKTIQVNGIPYNFSSDNELIKAMKEGLKLSYDYGFDFTLIK
jgi:uracil-DNA glycosylase